MQQLSMIYFDLGDVLFHWHPARRLKAMSSASGIPEQELNELLWTSGFSSDCDAGKYTAQEMHQKACDLINWHPSYIEFRDLWTSAFELNDAVFAVARSIKPEMQKGILTNNPEILREVVRDQYPQVEELFNPIIFSSICKFVKPDEQIFLQAIQLANCAPDEILFIDDSQRHVDGAQKVGMNAILFTSANELIEQLTPYRILS